MFASANNSNVSPPPGQRLPPGRASRPAWRAPRRTAWSRCCSTACIGRDRAGARRHARPATSRPRCRAIGARRAHRRRRPEAALNLQAGGALAADLHALYAYVALRLTQANLRNDDAALDECSAADRAAAHGLGAIADQVGLSTAMQRRMHHAHAAQTRETRMKSALLNYYEAIEKASQDMLEAARAGNWDHVVKLEGACALLISQLKHAAPRAAAAAPTRRSSSRASCSASWSTTPRSASSPSPGSRTSTTCSPAGRRPLH